MTHLFKFLIILLVFNTSTIKAQGINDIENDSIVNIPNSDLSLIYNKKTTAVWHNFANFYVVEPTKNWFVYLHSAELLVEVDYKHNTFFAVIEDELTGGYKRFLIGKDNFKAKLIEVRKACFLKDKAFKMDTTIFDLSFNKLKKKQILKINGEIGLQIDREKIIITDYQFNYPSSEAIMSTQFPGEDSINADGHVCYNKYGFKYTTSKTGVYSFKKKWLIPRIFNTIKQSKSEFITNPSPTNLHQLNSQVWRKKHCKWELKSATYSSIEKVGSTYICTTQIDEYDQFSYLVLDKNLKPIEINDFYNFDLVKSVKNGIKVTPILSTPKLTFLLDFKGNIINSETNN